MTLSITKYPGGVLLDGVWVYHIAKETYTKLLQSHCQYCYLTRNQACYTLMAGIFRWHGNKLNKLLCHRQDLHTTEKITYQNICGLKHWC